MTALTGLRKVHNRIMTGHPATKNSPTRRRLAMISGSMAAVLGLGLLGTGGAVAAGGGLAPPAVDAATVYVPTAVPDRVILTPTDAPATSQNITWRTSTNVTAAQVQYAKTGTAPVKESDATTVEAQLSQDTTSNFGYGMKHHTATITGLTADTTYVYRVGDGETYSEWYEFTTATDEVGGFSFIVQGDTQNDNKAYASRALRAAFEARPYSRLTVHAGDLIDTDNADNEWGEWHLAAGFANGYQNQIATPGNHEYYPGPGLSDHWRTQFEFPANGPADERMAETVYYTDYQGVRFISLDTNLAFEDAGRNAQTAWLESVLTDNPNKWTVVTFHHPLFSVTSGRDNASIRDAWLPVLEKHDVDLVVQGHDHAYGRGNLVANEQNLPAGADAATSHTGPVYLVSVAGPKMYVPDAPDNNNWVNSGANQRVVARDVQLFQTVDVLEDQLHYESRTVDGALIDAFTIDKDDAGEKLVTDSEAWPAGPGSTREGMAESPVDPTDPTDPEVPVDPTDPTDPEVPVDPTDPTDPETPIKATIGVSTDRVVVGGTISITGRGFDPNEIVTIELHSNPITLGRVTADSTGAFTASVTIPESVEPGTHTVRVSGVSSKLSAESPLIVTGKTIASTGAPLVGGAMLLGVLLLAAGAFFFLRARRINPGA